MRADEVYFDTVGQMNDLIAGMNLGAEYRILNHFGVKLSAQYYASSLYKERSWENKPVDKISPWVIQAGITFEP